MGMPKKRTGLTRPPAQANAMTVARQAAARLATGAAQPSAADGLQHLQIRTLEALPPTYLAKALAATDGGAEVNAQLEEDWARRKAFELAAAGVLPEAGRMLQAHLARCAFGGSNDNDATPLGTAAAMVRQTVLDCASGDPALSGWLEPALKSAATVGALRRLSRHVSATLRRLGELQGVRALDERGRGAAVAP